MNSYEQPVGVQGAEPAGAGEGRGGTPADRMPAEILEYLTPRLRAVLANLDGAPEAVCQAAVQLLPFGSRASLEATGLAVAGEDVDGHGHRSLLLTPKAFAVMAEAAAQVHAAPPRVSAEEWDRRAARALAGPSAATPGVGSAESSRQVPAEIPRRRRR
jgi:hypothetical protein